MDGYYDNDDGDGKSLLLPASHPHFTFNSIFITCARIALYAGMHDGSILCFKEKLFPTMLTMLRLFDRSEEKTFKMNEKRVVCLNCSVFFWETSKKLLESKTSNTLETTNSQTESE